MGRGWGQIGRERGRSERERGERENRREGWGERGGAGWGAVPCKRLQEVDIEGTDVVK